MPKGHVRFLKPSKKSVAPKDPTRFTCDDVEGHEWFARLPAKAQQEMRDRQEAVATRHVERVEFVKTTRKRAMTEGALVFLFNETFCAMPSWPHSAAAIVVGIAVGWWWNRVGAGRFRCMVTSIAPYAALRLVFADTSGPVQLAASCIFGVLGFVMLMGLAAFVGTARERRRADDLDH